MSKWGAEQSKKYRIVSYRNNSIRQSCCAVLGCAEVRVALCLLLLLLGSLTVDNGVNRRIPKEPMERCGSFEWYSAESFVRRVNSRTEVPNTRITLRLKNHSVFYIPSHFPDLRMTLGIRHFYTGSRADTPVHDD
jgi:hypothetical protein